jgi:hypothetical protein
MGDIVRCSRCEEQVEEERTADSADALVQVAFLNDVTAKVESTHGVKYIVDGRIETPVGRSPWVRTVWIVDHGQTAPRLVTAYPQQPESGEA